MVLMRSQSFQSLRFRKRLGRRNAESKRVIPFGLKTSIGRTEPFLCRTAKLRTAEEMISMSDRVYEALRMRACGKKDGSSCRSAQMRSPDEHGKPVQTPGITKSSIRCGHSAAGVKSRINLRNFQLRQKLD
jgi:hypothetical protein